MKYQQLTSNERYIISHLQKQGFNCSEIARQIGRHRSTISRELKRNRCHGIDNCYRHSRAQRRMSHETIYQYIWRDKAAGGLLWRHLRQSSKQRRKRYQAYDSRGRLAGKRNISERPKIIETRRTKEHIEIDTVQGTGSKDCIVTMVERKSGYVLIGKLKDLTQQQCDRIAKKLNQRPRKRHGFKTPEEILYG